MIMRQLSRATCVLVLYFAYMAAVFANTPAPTNAGTNFRDCARACPLMVVIPPGSFVMGTNRLDIESDGREGPPHTVNVARPFAVGVFDVTRGEFARFIAATGYRPEAGCDIVDSQGRWVTDGRKDWRNPGFTQTDRDPIVCVSWDDAQAYIAWLNRMIRPGDSGRGPYRLPSEAEWEYVARAGSATLFSWGQEPGHDLANYGIEHCSPCGAATEGRDRWLFTSPVGSFAPNAFGVYDTSGNVWQWTQDCMHYRFDGAPSDGTAWMTDSNNACYNRVVRGGSWLDPGILLAVYVRNPWAPGSHNNANGFRVARTLE